MNSSTSSAAVAERPETGQITASANWKQRAVTEWHKGSLTLQIGALIGDDVELPEPKFQAAVPSIVLDGVAFILKTDTGYLEVEAPCPRCSKPQHSGPIQSLINLGRTLDSWCSDCTFIASSGMASKAA